MKLQLASRSSRSVSFRVILFVNTTTLVIMNLSQQRQFSMALSPPASQSGPTPAEPPPPPPLLPSAAVALQRVQAGSRLATTTIIGADGGHQNNYRVSAQQNQSSLSAPALSYKQQSAASAQSSQQAATSRFRPSSVSGSSSSSSSSGSQREHHDHDRSSKLVAAAAAASTNIETSALVYLQKYGYMQAPANGAETNNLVSEESFSSAVADFQRFAGLPQTGNIDNQTLELMRMPRCGNSDKWRPPSLAETRPGAAVSGQLTSATAPQSTTPTISKSGQLRGRLAIDDSEEAAGPLKRRRRRKRYALQGSKWRRQELTYRISQYPTRLSGKRHEVDAQIERAFGIWSQVAPIDFVVKKEGRVHIDIRFASGDHGDGDAFDGPGNTLAHAYFPQYGGDAHFDDQEYWTIDSYAGTNIFQVAAHELGHSLGLGHSNVREALMAPFYQKYKPHFRLHVDDVLAIQALYGEKPLLAPDVPPILTGPPTPTTTTTTPPPPTTTMGSTTPTTTTTTVRPPLQPFPGTRHPIYKGARRTTTSLPAPPTAAPSGDDDKENGIPDLSTNGINGFGSGGAGGGVPGVGGFEPPAGDGEPAVGPGSSHGPGVLAPGSYPADLCTDSALDAITRTEDGNTYAFKGDFYWLLVNEGLARGYPRRISADWEGLPGQLDAALTWADGKTFFFKGNKYWRFKNKRRDVGYPKLISAGFAGIPDDLDAAFVWSGNGRTYFFKGAEYWRFDSKADPPVSSEYPRSIKVWMGVPAHLNAAFKWENNVTYFFKGNQYYRFNDKEFRVESRGRPAFPRQTAEWWFGCVNSNLAQRALWSGSLRHGSATMASANSGSNLALAAAQTSDGAMVQPTAATAAGGLGGEPSDWSFLAGLSEDSTRPLGTHISDHRPDTGPPTPVPAPLPDARSEIEASVDSASQGPDELGRGGGGRAIDEGVWQPPPPAATEWPPGRRVAIARQAPEFVEPATIGSAGGGGLILAKRYSGLQTPSPSSGLWNNNMGSFRAGGSFFNANTNDILHKSASSSASSSSPSAILNLTAQHNNLFAYYSTARLMIGLIVCLSTLATTLSRQHIYHHELSHKHNR